MTLFAKTRLVVAAGLCLVVSGSCSDSTAPADRVQCDTGNGGITLPEGFCAVVVADLIGATGPATARHIAVTPFGDVFVAINNDNAPFGIIGLRDANGDGRAEVQTQFSAGVPGSGIAWADGALYFGATDRVVRYNLPSGQLEPIGQPAVLVSGLPSTGDHDTKTLVYANAQTLFVNIGSASNSCQVVNRQPQSAGVFPCGELATRAGVWVFSPNGTNLTQADGRRYGAGYRNMVALAVNPVNNALYGVQHGRDMLFENWSSSFTVNEDAVLPSEEFVRIDDGSNNGWPYCYHDAVTENKKVLAPEYGGNGQTVSNANINCATFTQPIATFGAHWAPNGLAFYTGAQFPDRYRNGAFIAFHGGFDRAPLPNEGYKVMFVPMGADGTPSGPAEVFADGFAASTGLLPATAVHRPVGVTVSPDGSLYISDDKAGRIWRVVYKTP